MTVYQIDAENSLFHLYEPPAREGAPTFFFVNALTGSTDHWEAAVAPALRDAGFGTLSYNFRGQTGSAFAPSLELTNEVIVEDILTLYGALKPSTPILVGLSIGGLFAAQARAKGLDAAGLVFLNTLRRIGPRIAWINDALPTVVAEGGVQMFMDATFPLIVNPEFAAAARPSFLKGGYQPIDPAHGHMNLMRNSPAADWDFDWASLDLPVLSITGEHDRVFRDPEVIDELFALLPDARREDWDDCGHLVPLERPERLGESLIRFAREIEA
ncbi:alpha/beta fold hydrolase [Pikeienuella piscinae]|uniref:Alpha/beta fold hydrolase n=1 Tax=Pikeienuella piscinae TaxID=2748098 RepID=A0A7L5BTL0_9RHOB|nr:alpha/beta hydrolase [Pikeienuella piscinae]QIE55410.1 alpha/beta fold hydrolase [Pikeienuella piscinae]